MINGFMIMEMEARTEDTLLKNMECLVMTKERMINFISYCLWSVAGAGLVIVGGMTAELALLGLIFFYLITFTGPLGVRS